MTKRRRTTRPDDTVYSLIDDISRREPQDYTAPDGTLEYGVLLSPDEYDDLISWRKKQEPPRGRGRRKLQPSLLGNPYKEEFEREKKKIIASSGRERGAIKKAIASLARRHRVEFDTMRKRIAGR
jgi:hypothetical protein